MVEKKEQTKDPVFKSLAWCKKWAECDLKIAKRTQKFTKKEEEAFLKERVKVVKAMWGLR